MGAWGWVEGGGQILWPYVPLPIKGGICHHNLSFVGRHRNEEDGKSSLGLSRLLRWCLHTCR